MNYSINNKYDDIINLPHHISTKHPQMTLESRAAQFAPFAALTGYEDEVEETARLTTKRKEIDEELKAILDIKLQKIRKSISKKFEIIFTYFIKDSKKQGGKYITVKGVVKKIDEYNQIIILEDRTKIPILDIIDIKI